MSKLEVILITFIIFIIFGIGLYHLKNKIFTASDSEIIAKKIENLSPEESHAYYIGEKCIKISKKTFKIINICKNNIERISKVEGELNAARIKAMQNPSAAATEDVRIKNEEYINLQTLRITCNEFLPYAQAGNEILPLLKNGEFNEAKRLCDKIEGAIPEGF